MKQPSTEPEYLLARASEKMPHSIAPSNHIKFDLGQVEVDLAELSILEERLVDMSIDIVNHIRRLQRSLRDM